MGETAIQWTDATWDPVTGCTKVSPGCKHCYAEGVAERFWPTQYPAVKVPPPRGQEEMAEAFDRPRRFTDVQVHPERLEQPLRWRKPRRVFVNSMSDLFHEDVPDEFIAEVFAVMALAPHHTFQVLTKRPHRMRNLLQRSLWPAMVEMHADRLDGGGHLDEHLVHPAPNVWLGVSVEDQRRADERIPVLLDTPAAVRFLSCEPLLDRVDLSKWLGLGVASDGRGEAVPVLRGAGLVLGGQRGSDLAAPPSGEGEPGELPAELRRRSSGESRHGAVEELPTGAVHGRGAALSGLRPSDRVDGQQRGGHPGPDGGQPQGRRGVEQPPAEPGDPHQERERSPRAARAGEARESKPPGSEADGRAGAGNQGPAGSAGAYPRPDRGDVRGVGEDGPEHRHARHVEPPPGLSWLIVGGESGPKARPMDLAWARSLVEQGRAASVPVFVKQLGARPTSVPDRITYRGEPKSDRPAGFYRHLNHSHGGDPAEWPEDLRVREFSDGAQ